VRYDAIIVGASFAGLAVASRLRGNVLIIDKKDIGTGQTSACGTLLSVPQALCNEPFPAKPQRFTPRDHPHCDARNIYEVIVSHSRRVASTGSSCIKLAMA